MSSLAPESQDEQAVIAQAAEWFALLQDEHSNEQDRQRWQIWLAAHPAHARVWQRVEAISQPFRQLVESLPVQAGHDTLAQARLASRRRALRLLGMGAVLVGTGGLLRQMLPWQAWQYEYAIAHAGYRTGVGQRQRFTLADGTVLILNTNTAVDVVYGQQLRRIVLHRGEILVTSAHDQYARPLVVDTSTARVTALGTRFTVRSDLHGGHVAVFEGAVQVAPHAAVAVRVAAGQQARFNANTVVADGAADLAREAWSQGKIVADNIALSDFVNELVRYTTVNISVSPQVAALRLVGVYSITTPARDIPLILANLENALPVRVQQTAGANMVIISR
ncbi:FecR domain-containing protein [Methylophilus sp. OH31]|uniref:FecR domain-containing protein n=1 Tax=Methylophilus sp. OH31 TaxID=1387312 RepID=UPI000464B44D|nr:FecR domain-containing protein [Methylophilus sp. OH31]